MEIYSGIKDILHPIIDGIDSEVILSSETCFDEIPLNQQHIIQSLQLPEIDKCIMNWKSLKESEINQIWCKIQESGNLLHKIIIFICNYNLKQRKNNIQLAYEASLCYCHLLCVSGSSAFGCFQPVIFQEILLLISQIEMNNSIYQNNKNIENDNDGEEEVEKPNKKSKSKKSKVSTSHSTTDDNKIKLMTNILKCISEVTKNITISEHEDIIHTLLSTVIHCCIPEYFKTLFPVGIDICMNLSSSIKGNNKLYITILRNLISPITMQQCSTKQISILKQIKETILNKLIFEYCKDIDLQKDIVVLLQHLTIKSPTIMEYRIELCNTILNIIQHLTIQNLLTYIKFLKKCSNSKETSHRLISVNIAQILIQNQCIYFNEDDCSELSLCAYIGPVPLLNIINSRISDVIVTIRLASLQALSDILLFITKKSNDIVSQLTNVLNSELLIPNESNNNNAPILNILRNRLIDEKPLVRKSALELLGVILSNNSFKIILTESDIYSISSCVKDTSISVRKMALTVIEHLLNTESSNSLYQDIYIQSVLFLSCDCESTVCDYAIKSINNHILSKIIEFDKIYNKDNNLSDILKTEKSLVWMILNRINSDTMTLFENLIEKIYKDNKTDAKTIMKSCQRILQHFTDEVISDNTIIINIQNIIWRLLELLSKSYPEFIDADYIISLWNKLTIYDEDTLSLIIVIGNISTKIKQTDCEIIADKMMSLLLQYKSSPSLVHSLIITISYLYVAHVKNEKEAKEKTLKWSNQIIKNASTEIENYVMKKSSVSDELIIRYIHTAGEIATIGISESDENILSKLNIKIPDELQTYITSLLPSTFPNSSDPISSIIRAYAITATGKFCLNNQKLSKELLPMFLRELSTSNDCIIRNNIILILCDLCRKYTSIIDIFINDISLYLCDSDLMVRKHTMIALTQLLLEDYIKLKNVMLYSLILCLVDDDEEFMRKYAENTITQLYIKFPNMLSNQFVELICVMNNFRGHLLNIQLNEKTSKVLSKYSGNNPENRQKRIKIYETLTKRFSEEEKLSITNRLVQDILGGIIDSQISIDKNSINDNEVIFDTFSVLCNKTFQKTKNMSDVNDEDENIVQDENVNPIEEANLAKKKLMKSFKNQNYIQNIIPTLISLKHYFEQHKSSNMKLLLKYLMLIYKKNKNDILIGFKSDPQLLKELEYEVKRYELEEKRSKHNKQLNVMIYNTPVQTPRLSDIRQSPFTPTLKKTPKTINSTTKSKIISPIKLPTEPSTTPINKSRRESLLLSEINTPPALINFESPDVNRKSVQWRVTIDNLSDIEKSEDLSVLSINFEVENDEENDKSTEVANKEEKKRNSLKRKLEKESDQNKLNRQSKRSKKN